MKYNFLPMKNKPKPPRRYIDNEGHISLDDVSVPNQDRTWLPGSGLFSLKNLIERNKPMKVAHNNPSIIYGIENGDCPVCGKSVDKNDIEGDWKYCPYCGQKLDWSDEDGK